MSAPVYSTVIRRTESWNPAMRYRWSVVGAGLFGYSMTRRGAAASARAALFRVLELEGR